MIQSSSCDYNASSCTFRVMGARLQATRRVGPLGHQLLAHDSNRPCCVACAVLLCASLPMHACGRSGFDAGHVCCIVMMCICMIPGAGTPRGFAPQFLVPHVNEVRAEGTGWLCCVAGRCRQLSTASPPKHVLGLGSGGGCCSLQCKVVC